MRHTFVCALALALLGCSNYQTANSAPITFSGVVQDADITPPVEEVEDDTAEVSLTALPQDTTTVDAQDPPPDVPVFFVDVETATDSLDPVPTKDAGPGVPPTGDAEEDVWGGIDIAVTDGGGFQESDSVSPADNVFADVPWGSSDDVEPYDAGPVNYPDAAAGSVPPSICTPVVTELNLKEEKVGGKVDIIWWIDTSGSMSQEAQYLNQNINSFANYINGAKLDFRMILVGNGFGICVQPPLGGPGCTNGPNFMHVKQTIGSTNGNQVLINTYSVWQSFLRPDATKNFVAVTDDDSSTASQWFTDQLQQKDPANFAQSPQVPYGFIYHGIVGYEAKADCPTIAKKGTVYLDLVAKTGGSKFKVCDTNWAPMFASLAQNVVLTAKPGCTYTIPYPSNALLTSYIGLSYVAKDDLFAVPAAPANVCPGNGTGFTVNDPIAPVEITLCPASCDLLKGGGNLQFDFGCF